MPYDTIIVGVGAAGAAAAATLAGAGRRVLAIEAANRIGGRVLTVPFGNGVVELGAEWIHGTEKSKVYDAAMKASVEVKPHDLTISMYRSDGSEIDQSIANELINYAFSLDMPEKPRKLGEYVTEKLTEYLKQNHPSLHSNKDFRDNFLQFLNYLMDNYDAANDWNDITTDSRYVSLDGHQHMSWHSHGYKTLFDIILNKHNNGTGYPHLEIKLNTEVVNIEYGNEKALVKCKDGEWYTADNVIVTVSLGVLKERYNTMFTPALPPKKVQAIKTLSIGVMDKIIFHFNQRWWPENTTFYGFLWQERDRMIVSEQDGWMTKIFGASGPMGASNAVTMWTSGDTAKLVETLPEEIVTKKCLQLLKQFMGKDRVIPAPIAMIRSTWYSNPFTRGSYSHDAWGAPNPTAREELLTPLVDERGRHKVLFAGEATHQTRFSTVHGAMETGIREAMRLLPSSHI